MELSVVSNWSLPHIYKISRTFEVRLACSGVTKLHFFFNAWYNVEAFLPYFLWDVWWHILTWSDLQCFGPYLPYTFALVLEKFCIATAKGSIDISGEKLFFPLSTAWKVAGRPTACWVNLTGIRNKSFWMWLGFEGKKNFYHLS